MEREVGGKERRGCSGKTRTPLRMWGKRAGRGVFGYSGPLGALAGPQDSQHKTTQEEAPVPEETGSGLP
eukprot:4533012-Pyramimonas_sp.AAC.1